MPEPPMVKKVLSTVLSEESTILVGDVGGTNTRLKLFAVCPTDKTGDDKRTPGRLIKHLEYLNANYATFTDVVRTFLAAEPTTKDPPTAGCLAVAGPVERNRVDFTNRNWVIDGAELETVLGIEKLVLINDFVANGYGLLTLDHAKECICLQDAPVVPGAPIACVGAGTGLGQCFSTCADGSTDYTTFPSEGGHAEFAPRNDLEMELLNFLKKKFEQKHRVSVERVISGPGLANIYEFLSQKYPRQVTTKVQSEFDAAGDMKGRVVAMHASKAAADPYCKLCDQAMCIFLAAYGSECGVASLKFIPFGGMYVAGGLTPKNIGRITDPESPFMHAFHDKGRVSPLLKRVPLYAVMVEDIGQRGAHLVAYKQLQSVRKTTRKTSSIAHHWKSLSSPKLTDAGGAGVSESRKAYLATAGIAVAGFLLGVLVSRKR